MVLIKDICRVMECNTTYTFYQTKQSNVLVTFTAKGQQILNAPRIYRPKPVPFFSQTNILWHYMWLHMFAIILYGYYYHNIIIFARLDKIAFYLNLWKFILLKLDMELIVKHLPEFERVECNSLYYRGVMGAYAGPCMAPKTPAQPACICPYIWQPVCGVNGETYGNECLMNCAYVVFSIVFCRIFL